MGDAIGMPSRCPGPTVAPAAPTHPTLPPLLGLGRLVCLGVSSSCSARACATCSLFTWLRSPLWLSSPVVCLLVFSTVSSTLLPLHSVSHGALLQPSSLLVPTFSPLSQDLPAHRVCRHSLRVHAAFAKCPRHVLERLVVKQLGVRYGHRGGAFTDPFLPVPFGLLVYLVRGEASLSLAPSLLRLALVRASLSCITRSVIGWSTQAL